MKFYVNGLLKNTVPYTGLIDSCVRGDLRFGFSHVNPNYGSNGDPFNGKIDDIGIWNRALSGNEINQLFTSSTGLDCGDGKIGINVCEPKRNLHVKDVLRLEPRDTAPDNPGEGDIYYDRVLHKLRVYAGTQWRDCW
jgi:hypothetical protein